MNCGVWPVESGQLTLDFMVYEHFLLITRLVSDRVECTL